MSLATWTPDALSSELRDYAGACWRLVESQYIVSTLKLVDSLAEQTVLEELVEASKPAVPAECRHLDYLLSTPFRYDMPYRGGSRFRRAGKTAGIFYAAEAVETAVAELAFYRILFFADSPLTPWPADAAEYTAFAVAVSTAAAIDLTAPPLSGDSELWTDLRDYGPCQTLAEACRAAGGMAIRYTSVRDPQARANLAVLACRAFAQPSPLAQQTWRLKPGSTGVQAVCAFPRQAIEFGRTSFAVDPRIAGLNWERKSV